MLGWEAANFNQQHHYSFISIASTRFGILMRSHSIANFE
jgi:hypothetical protein